MIKSQRDEVKGLMYSFDKSFIAGLGDDPRPIDEVIRIHLFTESLLEKIIRIVFGVNADALLYAKLTYTQKLSIVGDLNLTDGKSAVSSDVKGSLKKLNLLRNEIAHNIEHETTDEDVESLFVGALGKDRIEPAISGDVWIKLSSYKTTILMSMLEA